MAIAYALEPSLSAEEFVDVLNRSTLAERRPVDDPTRIEGMLRNADIMVTARAGAGGVLVGVSRAISDFQYATYLSDLAVDVAYQRQGIGRQLIAKTHAIAPRSRLILLAAPAAASYYPHVGFEQHEACWTRTEKL